MNVRALAIVLALAPSAAMAEWVHATGAYIFPPVMPEAEACQYAEERARADAIRRVTGESLAAEETLRCTEQGEVAECSRNSAIWSTVDGFIGQNKGKSVNVANNVAGHRECVVAFEADVQASQGRPDPNFDLGVGLNQEVFRDGESLVVTLSPSRRMAVQVFQWLPYEAADKAVSRVFPNAFDMEATIARPVTVPTEAGAKRYELKLGFPQGMPPGRKMVDEYLVVVATPKPLDLRDSYSLEDFRRLLAELPRGEARIVRKAYNIVRGSR